MKIPSKPIDVQAVPIAKRFSLAPFLLVVCFLLSLLLTAWDHRLTVPTPRVPPVWLLVGPDGSYRVADPHIESMDLILAAEQFFVVKIKDELRQWGSPMTFAISRTPVMTLLPAEGTDPIELTPDLRKLILAHWDHPFSEQDIRSLNAGSQTPYTFWPFAFIIDAVLWTCLLMGLYWSVRLIPIVERNRRRFIYRDRLKHTLCPVCKYSLAGLEQPIAQCPECGCSWFNQST